MIIKFEPQKDMTSQQILVIDDDESTLETLSSFLQEMGYDVISVKSGLAGLEIVKSSPPDLVISDIRMNGLNGIELAYLVKGLGYGVPVILISAYDYKNNPVINECSVGYLEKPLEIYKLKNMIDTILCRGSGLSAQS